MLKIIKNYSKIIILLILLVSSCDRPTQDAILQDTSDAPAETEITVLTETPTFTLTPPAPESLTICTNSEPDSLFPYADSSFSSRAIREAIFDGSIDIHDFSLQPVILEQIPGTTNGGVSFQPVDVKPGELLTGKNNRPVNLAEGVEYLPSGCSSPDCAVIYAGTEPVLVDQMVVRFQLRDGITWQDGTPLTAEDSVFAFQVAASLYPRVRTDLLQLTQAYQSSGPLSIEWLGIPGFRSSQYVDFFFTPMPKHVWGNIAPEELFTSEVSSKFPMGYGAYQVESWDQGESITLTANPAYFRNSENLSLFDQLIFRFLPNIDQALQGLLEGQCDILDESYRLDAQSAELAELDGAGRLSIHIKEGTAWEQISMNLLPSSGEITLLQDREVRHAIASCVDRQAIVDRFFAGQIAVSNSYALPDHPDSLNGTEKFQYDPTASIQTLESLGWLDVDGDPTTPRTSSGNAVILEGTPLSFNYLVSDDQLSTEIAEMVRQSLVQCGIGVELNVLPQAELLATGPEGPLFGRQFQLAQFSWAPSLEPPCGIYLSSEVPGPYPVFPRGWGGPNAVGYSNPAFDRACMEALTSMPDVEIHSTAHKTAQQVFFDDSAVIPLFFHEQVLVTRPDLCGLELDPSVRNSFQDIEMFAYGDKCD